MRDCSGTQEKGTDENDRKMRGGQPVEEKERCGGSEKGKETEREQRMAGIGRSDVTVGSWGGCCFTLQSHSLSVHSVI